MAGNSFCNFAAFQPSIPIYRYLHAYFVHISFEILIYVRGVVRWVERVVTLSADLAARVAISTS